MYTSTPGVETWPRPTSVATLDGLLTDEATLALLTLLHRTPAPAALDWVFALPDAHWRALLALAEDQAVANLLYQRLEEGDDLARVRPEWVSRPLAIYHRTTARNMAIYSHLASILDRLAAAAMPVIVLKGAYLATSVYPTLGARAMGDIDLLLPRQRMKEAAEILTRLGYHTDLAYADSLLDSGHHLPRFIHESHAVELHYHLRGPDQPLPIAVDELWERATPATIADRPVLVLCAEDQLLHLAIHGALQHQLGLDMRFLLDILYFTQAVGSRLDWDRLMARAHRLGWARSLCLALTLAHELLGAPIPAQALSAARPPQPVLHAALNQLFSSTRSREESNRAFAELWDGDKGKQQVAYLLSRIFLPRLTLAKNYKVSPSAPWLPLYYLARVGDLLQRYGRHTWALWRGDAALQRTLQRIRLLDRWVTGREG